MVGIDHHDRLAGSRLDDELPHPHLLLGGQTQIGARFGPHRAVDVEPGVKHAHLHQPINPLVGQQVIDVRAAQAGADAGEDLVVQAVVNALHRLVEHTVAAPPLVADDLGPFDTDQRRHVPQPTQFTGHLAGDEMPVGENLEVALRVTPEDLQDLRVHERLTPDDPEENVAHRLGLGDQPRHRLDVDTLLLGRHVNPAALATQVAAVDDRNVKERGKELAPLQAAPVFHDRADPAQAHDPEELPGQTLVGLQQEPLGHLQIHCFTLTCARGGRSRPSPVHARSYHPPARNSTVRSVSERPAAEYQAWPPDRIGHTRVVGNRFFR